jgi:hypothetical protein
MPRPIGINGPFSIFHLKQDDSIERIFPVYAGNGLYSFSITEFSTFAFVEEIPGGNVDIPVTPVPERDSGGGGGTAVATLFVA